MTSRNKVEVLIDGLIDTEYYIREVRRSYGESEAYEVAKFTGGSRPAAVYRVARTDSGWHCDCPGASRIIKRQMDQHKHVVLVRAWIKRGKPNPITTPGFQDWVHKILGN